MKKITIETSDRIYKELTQWLYIKKIGGQDNGFDFVFSYLICMGIQAEVKHLKINRLPQFPDEIKKGDVEEVK